MGLVSLGSGKPRFLVGCVWVWCFYVGWIRTCMMDYVQKLDKWDI